MPENRPRAVFDCMIFLQAAARRESPSGACLTLVEEGLVELYVSPAILAEVKDVVSRPRIRAKFQRPTDGVIGEFIVRLARIATFVEEVGTAIALARDPKDEPYLNLAAQTQADYLVSRDRDLLDIAKTISQKAPHLRILDPVAFLFELRARSGSRS